jgi:hypothetical protein
MAQLIEVENPGSAVEDNGNEVSDAAVVGASEPEAEQQPKARGLYFVRIPKPKTDDIAEIKSQQAEFQALVAKLKAMNAKLTAKRVSPDLLSPVPHTPLPTELMVSEKLWTFGVPLSFLASTVCVHLQHRMRCVGSAAKWLRHAG